MADRMERAQRHLTTGLRMAQVSDDPDRVTSLLVARAHLEATQQIRENLGRVKAETDTAEQVLQHAVQLFERARTLGAQGATGTQTADARAVIAQEIGSLLEQMVGVAATSVEGRFIFSGDADQTEPYTIDLTQSNPVSLYQGSAATRLVQHPNGTTFSVARTAQDIFDSADPATNVFSTLNALRLALAANDEPAIRAALDGLKAAGDYLNTQLAFYGTRQSKIVEALDFGQSLEIALTAQISGIQDADLTEAILELNQGQIGQQAALESWSRIPRTTLFDYLG
jgi:flagellar hook-associated protein 3 FlgL